MSGYRTSLGRARGLGSAGSGVGPFIAQRVTAAALVLLVAWGLGSALGLARTDYPGAVEWLRSPLNAVLADLLAVAAFWHMQIGMRVIIEDYIEAKGPRAALLIGNLFLCWIGAALTIVCLMKVAFGGAAAL